LVNKWVLRITFPGGWLGCSHKARGIAALGNFNAKGILPPFSFIVFQQFLAQPASRHSHRRVDPGIERILPLEDFQP
jgi:hypothetical protein